MVQLLVWNIIMCNILLLKLLNKTGPDFLHMNVLQVADALSPRTRLVETSLKTALRGFNKKSFFSY